jgi:ribonucleoside-triphosphate reductase (formate)
MEAYVIKRNGEYAPFEAYKIEDAMDKAFKSVQQAKDKTVFLRVLSHLTDKTVWGVEEIQDFIEKALFDAGHFQVMRSFMLFRHTRKLQREHGAGLNEDTTYINSTQTIEEYVEETDWRINANANTSYSNAGLVNNVAGKVIANFWLDKVYAKEEGYAHRNGDIHIHDLDCLTGYCA